MLKNVLILSAIALTSACASQGGQNTAKSDDSVDRDRVDEAFNDGRCTSDEARRGDSVDCQEQSARSREQRDPFSSTRDSLNELSIDQLELDQGLQNTGNQGLLR